MGYSIRLRCREPLISGGGVFASWGSGRESKLTNRHSYSRMDLEKSGFRQDRKQQESYGNGIGG